MSVLLSFYSSDSLVAIFSFFLADFFFNIACNSWLSLDI